MKPKMILQVSVLVAAAASLALSISLYFSGDADVDKLNGIYVGVWVPSILSLGAFLIWCSHFHHCLHWGHLVWYGNHERDPGPRSLTGNCG